MTTRAVIKNREAFLFHDFGRDMAARYFLPETLAKIPLFVRGKNKDKPKGKIVWEKVEQGGWRRGSGDSGYVENRVGKVIRVELHIAEWEKPGQIIAVWHEDLNHGTMV